MGCGASQHTSDRGFHPGWYALHFSHAVVAARRPDSSPWHVTAADKTALVIAELAGFAFGNPGLGTTIGKALVKPGGEPLAPAPYVVLRIGGRSFRNAPVERSYTPAWDQP